MDQPSVEENEILDIKNETTEKGNVVEEQQVATPQRCEFPEEVGGLTGGKTSDGSNFIEEDDPDGIVSLVSTIYTNIPNITEEFITRAAEEQNFFEHYLDNVVTTNVNIVKFQNNQSAETLYTAGPTEARIPFSSCELAGVSGICVFDLSSLSDGSLDKIPYTMGWLEGETIKTVEVIALKQQSESIEDVDKRLKMLVALFVSTFKGCKI
jgi:hypothetical protein